MSNTPLLCTPKTAARNRLCLYQEAPIGIANVSTDLRLTGVNRHLCELLGYREQELMWLPREGK